MKLQALIKMRKEALGITYDQMVAKAARAGFPISRGMFHHYQTDDWDNIPTTDSINGLAAAIDVDPDEVLAAAAESVGITTRELHLGRETRALLALIEDRTPAEIAALEGVLRSVARAMDAGRDPSIE